MLRENECGSVIVPPRPLTEVDGCALLGVVVGMMVEEEEDEEVVVVVVVVMVVVVVVVVVLDGDRGVVDGVDLLVACSVVTCVCVWWCGGDGERERAGAYSGFVFA